ncbi:MAG: hypothetical protein JXR77_04275 [Lentisphaeria bacterium]|nr:hypothetical protein [Lentisphaeria bacterium]
MPVPGSRGPTPDPAAKPRSRWRGCLVVTAIVAAVLLIVVVITVLVVARRVRRLRDEYTDTEMRAVPVAETSAPQARRLSRTFEDLQSAVRQGRASSFAFTDLQLNQMVASLPAVKEARGRAYFTIVGDQLQVRAGIPLDQVPGFQGRYLNGEFTIRLRLEHGLLQIYIQEASVRGSPLPPSLMEHLRNVNIAEQALQNPDFRKQLQGIRALRIQDGKLIVETGSP